MLTQRRQLRSLGRILQSHETLPRQSLERLAAQRVSAFRFHLTPTAERMGGIMNPVSAPRKWPHSGGTGGFSREARDRASLQRLARWYGKGQDGAAHVSALSGGVATVVDLLRAVERIHSTQSWTVAAPTKLLAAAWTRLPRRDLHLWVGTASSLAAVDLPVVRTFGPPGIELCALECPQGSLHFQIDRFFPEWDVTDASASRQELLVTDLDGRLQPLIRARTGVDWQLDWNTCPCGVTLPVLVTE